MNDTVLTMEAIEQRRSQDKRLTLVSFAVRELYGLSRSSIRLPLGDGESIDSGQVCLTIDPEADPTQNVGIADHNEKRMVVRYGIQAVFPGLYELVRRGKHDPSLLDPVKATATDECTLTEEMDGWRALGCLDFLPGSLWGGAKGG